LSSIGYIYDVLYVHVHIALSGLLSGLRDTSNNPQNLFKKFFPTISGKMGNSITKFYEVRWIKSKVLSRL
jgi:hypothetical protein